MKIHEYKGKKIFSDNGMPVQDGYIFEKLENAGVEVTYRAKYIDLLATTMPRNLITEISTWEGVVMLDDIGKAEPHMATAVPTMGVDNVWNDYGIYGEGISIAIVDTGVNNAHVGLDDFDDNGFTKDTRYTDLHFGHLI